MASDTGCEEQRETYQVGRSWPERVDTWLRRLTALVFWSSGTLLALVAIGITYDVMARRLFSAPTTWAFEFSQIGMVFIASLPMGYALLEDRHVSMDMLTERLSEQGRFWATLLVYPLGLGYCLLVTFLSMGMVEWALRTASRTVLLGVPMALLQAGIAIGWLVLSIAFVLRISVAWRELRGKRSIPEVGN